MGETLSWADIQVWDKKNVGWGMSDYQNQVIRKGNAITEMEGENVSDF